MMLQFSMDLTRHGRDLARDVHALLAARGTTIRRLGFATDGSRRDSRTARVERTIRRRR